MSDETVRLKEALKKEQERRFAAESRADYLESESTVASLRTDIVKKDAEIQRLKDQMRAIRRHRVHK